MTRMTGKEALMQIFHQERVEYIFGIPGATEVLFMDALETDPDIKYILGLHETVAMGMAEGYSRTSGKEGVLNLHTNAGLAASLPLLANAFQGGVPLVVTAGQQDTRLLAQEPALGADLVRIAGPFTKWATEIANADDIPLVMRRAFKVASHPPQGPVFVSLPQNLMDQPLDFEYDKGGPSHTELHPDPQAVQTAVSFISQANRPLIIVGDGVTKNEALDKVVELAELIGAQVYQPWMSDVNFPVDHPLYSGDLDTNDLKTRKMLEAVDVLIVIGALFFSQAIYTPQPLLPHHVKAIQIDNDPWQMGKNFPLACGIEGNIKIALADLVNNLRPAMLKEAIELAKLRLNKAADEKREALQALEEKEEQEKDNIPIAVTRLMQELRYATGPGTRVVDDSWSCSAILRHKMDFNQAKSYQRARGGGSIGWGLPGAIGVKLASPGYQVVCVSGDGSAMWSIQSLWTAAHYDIPVKFLICSNGCYRQVRIMKDLIMRGKGRNRVLGTDISRPRIDFSGLAESLGVHGTTVERPEELKKALTSILSSDKPELLEIRIEGDQ